jgi:hypothetical protein
MHDDCQLAGYGYRCTLEANPFSQRQPPLAQGALSMVLVSNLTKFEHIERMIASTDARWERALSNIARRREALAQGLRHMAAQGSVSRPISQL